ncbi:MAG: Gldg family protein [Myxococcota bacterium]
MADDLLHAARGTLALAYRELLSLFVTPLAYVVGTLFLLLQGWNFSLLLQVLNDPLAAPGPVMQFYFGGSFFIFWLPVIFLCASLAMRLLAEERRQGTLEALLTAPLSPTTVVLGKFLGVVVFYVALWSPTAVFYVLLRGANVQPDVGPIAAGYLGTFMVGCSFLAIGLMMSAMARSQLQAAISTSVACTILLLTGLLVDQVESPVVAEALAQTSLLSMMQEMAQGIVDTRWIGMHAAIVVVSLVASVLAVDPRRDLDRVVRGIAIAVAVLHGAWLGGRHAVRQDWTASQMYALSDRARDVLGELEGPIEVRVLVPETIGAGRPNPLGQELREVLARMSEASDALRVQFLDPDRDRQEAEQLVADFGLGGRDLADGVVLIRAGQGAELRRAHRLPGDLVTYATGADVQATGPRVQEFRGEEALLSAFLSVTTPLDVTVCATAGHGEPRFDNLEPFGGYAHLSDLIKDAGLGLRTADLDDADGLAGCGVVLVGGPSGLLPPPHVDALGRYVDAGGSMLVLSGAVVRPGANGLAEHGLEPLLRRFGIASGQRIVVDPEHPMPGAAPLLAFTIDQGWGSHPAVRALVSRAVSFVLVRELSLVDGEDGSRPDALVYSAESSWAEADVAGIRAGTPAAFDADDARGPLVLAAAGTLGNARAVVIASDQFAYNAFLRDDVAYDHGRDLVLNALGWLTAQDALLGIRPRERTAVKLVLMPEQLRRMVWVCLFGLPGFGVALAVWVLWRRRR